MLKAVFFDLDNTLVDFMKMKRSSVEAAASAMIDAGLPLTKAAAVKRIFGIYSRHGIEDQQVFQRLLKRTAGRIDYRILATGIAAYRRVQTGYLTPYPGVRSTLLALKEKGVKLAIVSDAPRMRAWMRLASMNLAEFFDAVITLGDAKLRKPAPRPFKKALKQLGVRPEEVLFVGDNPERDLAGAKALGMKTAWAKYGAEPRMKRGRQRVDLVLKGPAGLLKAFP
ncbi:MAG: TIGR02253 family HAD-type hydrolase [Candidatus Micrarchaeota archaeon]